MTELDDDHKGLDVVGRGNAMAADLTGPGARRKASVYADPVSWLVLEAVERAVADCPELLAAREAVGHVVVSDHCTLHSMRQLAEGIAAGRVSPLRFSGANPGLLCSLPCHIFGFNGPSITLSMPPERGVGPALAIARGWLCRLAATHVVLTSHHTDEEGHHIFSRVLRRTPQEVPR